VEHTSIPVQGRRRGPWERPATSTLNP
jgi:hypothetical protein